jgi:hypothetical protein
MKHRRFVSLMTNKIAAFALSLLLASATHARASDGLSYVSGTIDGSAITVYEDNATYYGGGNDSTVAYLSTLTVPHANLSGVPFNIGYSVNRYGQWTSTVSFYAYDPAAPDQYGNIPPLLPGVDNVTVSMTADPNNNTPTVAVVSYGTWNSIIYFGNVYYLTGDTSIYPPSR